MGSHYFLSRKSSESKRGLSRRGGRARTKDTEPETDPTRRFLGEVLENAHRVGFLNSIAQRLLGCVVVLSKMVPTVGASLCSDCTAPSPGLQRTVLLDQKASKQLGLSHSVCEREEAS